MFTNIGTDLVSAHKLRECLTRDSKVTALEGEQPDSEDLAPRSRIQSQNLRKHANEGVRTMTRRLVITENITLDGVVENDGSWFDPTEDSEQGQQLAEITREHAAASDGFLAGRITFEEMRGFWPQMIDDATGVTDHLNRVEKYVVSSSLEDPDWEGTTVLRGGGKLEAQIRELQSREGTDIVLTGSISLAQELLTLGMVDELRLFVYPVVVGAGRRLFTEKHQLRDLALVESRAFRGGVVLVRYTRSR